MSRTNKLKKYMFDDKSEMSVVHHRTCGAVGILFAG